MSNNKENNDVGPFSRAFAAEYKEYAKAHKVRQTQIADLLGRAQSYISRGMNGLRALDTEDVDALAKLSGTTGKSLLIELARLTKIRVADEEAEREERAMRHLADNVGLAAHTDPEKNMPEDYGA